MALNQVSGVPVGVLRVISCVILTYTRTFSNREPIPFESTCPELYEQQKLGMIRCIFVEAGRSPYGDLKGAPHHFPKALWKVPWGTGWPRNDLRVISDGFLPRSVHFEGGFKRVCEKPAGVLMVIWSGFLAPIRSFSKGAPHFPKAHALRYFRIFPEFIFGAHFPKAHALRYGHRKFGNDRVHIRGEWALRRWHWI